MQHLEGVITRYCTSISTQIVFKRPFNFFGMFLIVCEMIFRLMIFNATVIFLRFVIMAVALLTNQAVFDNISLMKIEAHCMLSLLLRFYFLLLYPDFNLESNA